MGELSLLFLPQVNLCSKMLSHHLSCSEEEGGRRGRNKAVELVYLRTILERREEREIAFKAGNLV